MSRVTVDTAPAWHQSRDLLEDAFEAMGLLSYMPPPPFFASYKLFSADHALSFEHDGRKYAGAHPAFWARVPASARGSGLHAVRIHDLDSDRDQRIAFFQAMSAAMEEGK